MGPRERNVRVYTVACESRHVLVHNVPALGVIDELLARLRLYGDVCAYHIVDPADVVLESEDDPAKDGDAARVRELETRFTQVVYVQYATVNNARHAKVRATQKPLFGSMLQIAYAPQFETRDDTLAKLTERRELLQRRAGSAHRYLQPVIPVIPPPHVQPRTEVVPTLIREFIGPQLPPRDWHQAPPAHGEQEPKRLMAQSHPLEDPKPKRRRI